jgi:hypothetical protein
VLSIKEIEESLMGIMFESLRWSECS